MLKCREMTSGYIITLADPAQLPKLIQGKFLNGHHQARIAFVGRSNVGKSSLINCLMKERVARVSATPGKTRAIHFFLWKEADRIIADLPGYGFAKVAKEDKREWSKLLDSYFSADDHVELVMMLFDSRHGPTEADLEALDYFISKKKTVQVIMTKFDQLKTQSERHHRKQDVQKILAEYGIPPEHLYWVSTKDQKSLEWLRRPFL